jgi:hypothetical protein
MWYPKQRVTFFHHASRSEAIIHDHTAAMYSPPRILALALCSYFSVSGNSETCIDSNKACVPPLTETVSKKALLRGLHTVRGA